ncbi:GNAT family N-acetyltransferase [Kineosporia babensis]|uniref:GNAT family N-acetyltransferase n=1 Tax=Kineosporia babensis TaxID=499548 RepID=A0A9X1T3E9_9ACTN|nr:GNAT family N-acetyltransferase [Kineosporia babensis]MCD5315673.1 GNAT family N-acetyltransferase [Kineosporia babensis]
MIPEARGRGVEVVRLQEADWPALREARLMALRSSPDAFCGSYSQERLVHRRAWRRRLRTGSWTVARSGGRLVGLIGMLPEPDPVGGPNAPFGTRCIESVWVAPDFRGHGVLKQMLASVEEQALRQGVGVLVLWVLESNPVATEVYRRLGYRHTGIAQPISVRRHWDVENRLMKNLL